MPGETIWKYELLGSADSPAECKLSMPQDADVLCVQAQRDQLCLWARVDPDRPTELRTFRVIGTGHFFHEFPGGLHYVGTCQVLGGTFVWHVFEIGKGRN